MKRNDQIFFIIVTGAPIDVLGAVITYKLTHSPIMSMVAGVLCFLIWSQLVLIYEVTQRMENL